jgi:hypothetical protein
MSEGLHDWDGWLDRLVDDDTARKVADIRAYLIAEISRALSQSEALGAAEADRLAEIAVARSSSPLAGYRFSESSGLSSQLTRRRGLICV